MEAVSGGEARNFRENFRPSLPTTGVRPHDFYCNGTRHEYEYSGLSSEQYSSRGSQLLGTDYLLAVGRDDVGPNPSYPGDL